MLQLRAMTMTNLQPDRLASGLHFYQGVLAEVMHLFQEGKLQFFKIINWLSKSNKFLWNDFSGRLHTRMQDHTKMYHYHPLLQVVILIIVEVLWLHIFPEKIPKNGFGLIHQLVPIETKRRNQLLPFPLHQVAKQLIIVIIFLLTLEREKQKCHQLRLRQVLKFVALKKKHGIC